MYILLIFLHVFVTFSFYVYLLVLGGMHVYECGQVCAMAHTWGWNNVGVGFLLLSYGSQGWNSYILSVCCVYFPKLFYVLSMRHYLQAGFTQPRHARVPCARLVLKRERKGVCLRYCLHSETGPVSYAVL